MVRGKYRIRSSCGCGARQLWKISQSMSRFISLKLSLRVSSCLRCCLILSEPLDFTANYPLAQRSGLLLSFGRLGYVLNIKAFYFSKCHYNDSPQRWSINISFETENNSNSLISRVGLEWSLI